MTSIHPMIETFAVILAAFSLFGILCLAVAGALPTTAEDTSESWLAKLKTWLGIEAAPRPLTILFFAVALIYVTLFVVAILATFTLLTGVFFGGSADPSTTPAQSLGLGALLVALLSAPFVIWRSVVAQKTVDVTEQGLITDRINAAVASLGAQKERKIEALDAEGNPLRGAHKEPIILEETLPNMEVRIGAIYALERIARENLDFHVQIMEILCAYIRENSPAETAEPLHLPTMPANDVENPREAWERWREGYEEDSGAWHIGLWQAIGDLRSRITSRTDIQATLEVLGRRTRAQREREAGWPDPKKDGAFVFDAEFPAAPAYPDTYTAETHKDWVDRFDAFQSEAQNMHQSYAAFRGYRLDLRGTNLQFYDLQRLHLNGTRFEGAQMQGANLGGARMMGADLRGAQMMGADLWGAQMQGANLGRAQMMGANLVGAQMSEDTDLTAATLRGAAVRSVDDTTIAQLREFWEDTFADGTVQVPDGERPGHWPTDQLEYRFWDEAASQFHTEWREWQADPDGYTPPDPPPN